MVSQRQRPLVFAGLSLVAAWLVAWGGYAYARHSRVTAQKVRTYLHEVELGRLKGQDRQKALRDLAAKLNALPYEERREVRMDGQWAGWFQAMTDQEKSAFLEATLPTGFKQMLNAFEQLPEDKRRRAIRDAVARLKQAREEADGPTGRGAGMRGTNRPPALNEEMQQKVIKIGLKAFYSDSSAQTKAEAAPFLEELQRAMESGRLFHGRP